MAVPRCRIDTAAQWLRICGILSACSAGAVLCLLVRNPNFGYLVGCLVSSKLFRTLSSELATGPVDFLIDHFAS